MVVTLDEIVSGEVARARAMERALHAPGEGWEIRAGGFRIPASRDIDEGSMLIVFSGMLAVEAEIDAVELVHDGDLVSRVAARVNGPCVLRWHFRVNQGARYAA